MDKLADYLMDCYQCRRYNSLRNTLKEIDIKNKKENQNISVRIGIPLQTNGEDQEYIDRRSDFIYSFNVCLHDHKPDTTSYYGDNGFINYVRNYFYPTPERKTNILSDGTIDPKYLDNYAKNHFCPGHYRKTYKLCDDGSLGQNYTLHINPLHKDEINNCIEDYKHLIKED